MSFGRMGVIASLDFEIRMNLRLRGLENREFGSLWHLENTIEMDGRRSKGPKNNYNVVYSARY